MAKGILIAAMNIGNAADDEFNDWYDTEHLPERQRVPGFLSCQRWMGTVDKRVSIATYDLDSVDVLNSPGYTAIGGENLSPWSKRVTSRVERLMRFEGDQVLPGDRVAPDNAGGLLLNSMNVEPAAEAEFNEWYNTEHIPLLGAVPGVLCARRFKATSATAVMSRCTIWCRQTCRRPRRGKPPPTRRGPTACGRISATICVSSAANTSAPADLVDVGRKAKRIPPAQAN
jgi:hypothetical protein